MLTFGYPARERDPQRRTPEEWSAAREPQAARRARRARLASTRARACRSARRPSSGRAPPRPRRAGGRCRSPGCHVPASTIRISAGEVLRASPSSSRGSTASSGRAPARRASPRARRCRRRRRAARRGGAPSATRATSSRPSRGRRRPARPPRPSPPRCRATPPSAPSSFARSIFSCDDEVTSTRAPACTASWTANVETPLPAPRTSTVWPPTSPPTSKSAAVRGQRGERERGRLLPREARRLREDVLLRHLDELGVRAVVGAAEDPPVRPGRVLPRAPVEARVDDDLLAGVAPDAGAVRAGDHRQVELVRRAGRVADEQVAAVDRRRLQLDDDLAGPATGSG